MSLEGGGGAGETPALGTENEQGSEGYTFLWAEPLVLRLLRVLCLGTLSPKNFRN